MDESGQKDLPLTIKLEDGGQVGQFPIPFGHVQQTGLPTHVSYLPPHLALAGGLQSMSGNQIAAALLAQRMESQRQALQQQASSDFSVASSGGCNSAGPTSIGGGGGVDERNSRPVSPSSVSTASSRATLGGGSYGGQPVHMMQFVGSPPNRTEGLEAAGRPHLQIPISLSLNRLCDAAAEQQQLQANRPMADNISVGGPSQPASRAVSPSASTAGTATESAQSAAICGVCGDRSQNIRKHYGANSCEACKCFFRRSVQMDKQYQCRYSMSCPIGSDKRVRHWCQYCRFQKCLAVGMKKEAVKLHRNSFLSSGGGGNDSGRNTPVPPSKLVPQRENTIAQQPANSGYATNPPSPMETEAQAAEKFKSELSPGMLAASLAANAYMPSFAHLQHILPDGPADAPPDLIPGSALQGSGGGGAAPLPSAGSAGPTSSGASTQSHGSVTARPPSSSSSLESEAFPLPPMPNVSAPKQDRSSSSGSDDPGNEASVEEVLETFKHRILCLFQWSKQHVVGFSDLSAADQKALLRNSVVEIVMLGFAKRSINFDGSLQLVTGKMMSPGHVNPGVSSVANLLLDRVVKPLRQLNINDYEHMLLKQIILFNPVSSGVQDAQLVRDLRKVRLVELQEYTTNAEPGRIGEMLCIIPPLYEVSQEIVEQLRLEQFVNDGEMRFDAVLLMSIVNGEVSLTTVDPTADPQIIMTPPASKPAPSLTLHGPGRSTSPSIEF